MICFYCPLGPPPVLSLACDTILNIPQEVFLFYPHRFQLFHSPQHSWGIRLFIHLHVMVTSDELAAIHERMTEVSISNAGACVRKMALNGYILHIDLAPINRSLQRRCFNNLNQVAYTHMPTTCTWKKSMDWSGTMKSCGRGAKGAAGTF